MTLETKFGPGKIINFSEGEYSDYGFCGHVVTLCDVDLDVEAKAFLSQFTPEQAGNRWSGMASPNRFVAWLCAHQKVAEITTTEFYLGSYGRLELSA